MYSLRASTVGRWRFVTAFMFTVALLLALSVSSCNKSATHPAPANAPLPVSALKIQSQPVPLVLEVVGRTEGSKEVEVRARVSGILEKQLYTEGMVVKAGSILFRIDPAPYVIALEHARAALAGEQARNQQARRNADRLRELVAQRLVSRSDMDNAISAMEASDAAVLAAQANVREAQLNLSYTQVAAPIAGITGRALHSEGSLLTAGTDSSLLTTITQADPVWTRFALSASEYESFRAAIKSNQRNLKVELLHKDGSTPSQQGKVNFTGSTMDASLGTVQLRAEFPNSNANLLPGEYVRVRLYGGAEAGIIVPQTAVLQSAKGPFVWIINSKGNAEQREVKTGVWVGEQWQINEGLTVGERIIVDNLLKLKPGQAVQVSETISAANRATLDTQTSAASTPADGA